MNLDGPYWYNNEPVEAQTEQPPQEAFFLAQFRGGSGQSLQVTAQNHYQAWLNGRWLGSGPARAPHGVLTVDEWPLPDSPEGETQTLAVQVFWEGLFVFENVRGTPGLWLSVSDPQGPVSTDLWVTEQTGRIVTHRFSRQRGWGEEVDARLRADNWPVGPWNWEQWRRPVVRTDDPAVTLEARDIQPLSTVERRASQVTFAGACDPCQRTTHRSLADDEAAGDPEGGGVPARVLQEERLLPSRAVDRNLAALTQSGQGVATLPPDPDGADRTVQLDFGRQIAGLIEITLSAPRGTVVDMGWSEGVWDESQMNCWARSAQPGGSPPTRELGDSRQAVRFICAGTQGEQYTSLLIASFRHLRLAFRRPPGSNAVIQVQNVQARTLGYPIVAEGSFRCPDEDLNRIYHAAIETMENSVCDVYMDCPGRERAAWLNDSYWTAIGLHTVSGDREFDRRFLRQFLVSQSVMPFEGLVAPFYPSDGHLWGGGGHLRAIAGHGLFWLLQVERHLRLFGDADLMAEWLPGVTRAFDAFARYRSPEGFLEGMPWDNFFDWSDYQNGGILTANSFLYALTLTRLGELYGDAAWREQGAATARSIDETAWSADRELYADVVVRESGRCRAGEKFSALMNSVALWTEMMPPERALRVWHRTRNFHPMTLDRPLFGYETAFARSNLFGFLYRLEHAGRIDETECLVRDLKEAYLPQLERGQTSFGEHLGYESSLCHGYNGYATHLLARHVAGIELPDQPGGVIAIHPHPEIISWCQARVPWMGGHVQVWWSRTMQGLEVNASLPPGQRGELHLGGSALVTFDGSISFRSWTE